MRPATAVALLALTAPALAAPPQQPPAPPPNIILILADDLGYGDLACYGQKDIQTPNIDALAKQGLRFANAYAGSPVCAPSRCSLLTGLHTGHCLIRGNAKVSLRPQDTTVEELLHAAGYTTFAAGKWGLGEPDSPGTPAKKGFDFFFGFIDQTHAHNSYPAFLYHNDQLVHLSNVVPTPGPYGEGVATVQKEFANDLFDHEIVAFINRAPANKPFFLYAAFTAPHANNQAHAFEVPDLAPYADKPWPDPQKRYAALITRLDSYVGHISAALHERHLENNTLLLFASDNGPAEEGGNTADFFHSSGPLRGIKRDLYEGGIRIPLIAVWPNHIAPNTTTNQPVAFYDFLPTATDLARIPPSSLPKNLDGLSFLPTLLNHPADQQQHPFFYWEFHERGFEQAVRLYNPTGGGDRGGAGGADLKALRHAPDQPLELYNLTTDPAESHDIALQNPALIQQIETCLKTAHTDSPDFPIRPSATRRARPPE